MIVFVVLLLLLEEAEGRGGGGCPLFQPVSLLVDHTKGRGASMEEYFTVYPNASIKALSDPVFWLIMVLYVRRVMLGEPSAVVGHDGRGGVCKDFPILLQAS